VETLERTFSPPGVAAVARDGLRSDGGLRVRLLQLALFLTNEVIAILPSRAARHLWYRRVLGVEIAQGAKVFMHVTFSIRGRHAIGGAPIRIGRNTVINQGCWIDGRGGLRIGSNVNISRGAWILGGDHDIDDPYLATRYAPIDIGDRVFVGSRAIIFAGVTLGEGCVVGAGAVVTKDVAPYTVVAGVPARPIRTRSRDLRYELSYSPLFE
jgi:acetyltransferase-like isoleucine patch superfamily enzyme